VRVPSNNGVTVERAEADVELLARAREGDAAAFVELIRRHDRGLRRLAYRLLADRDAIDDALQEAYLKAFAAIPTFAGRAAPATWLYRIVYNACVDQLRRRRREPAAIPLDAVARAASVDSDLRLVLAEALAALPPEERAAVLLVDVEGFSYDEAATVVGVAGGTIASRLSRARAALRRALRTQEGVST
jgi:RNA polymerase sigma-70 factor (ECF subfamily)